MTGERVEKALARLDLALRRIETAATHAHTVLGNQAQQNGRLRQAISETLRDLDKLIGEQDRP